MAVGKHEKLIRGIAFRLAILELVLIRNLRRFHSQLTREFTTAILRCRLVKRRTEKSRGQGGGGLNAVRLGRLSEQACLAVGRGEAPAATQVGFIRRGRQRYNHSAV